MEKTRKMKSNTTMEKDLDNYYKQIAKALPAGGRKALLPGIREGVEAYLAENPDATMDDVIAYVGTPECIAGEYYANQDGREITEEIKVGKKILIMFLIAAVIIVLILVISVIFFLIGSSIIESRFVQYDGGVVSNPDLLPGYGFN